MKLKHSLGLSGIVLVLDDKLMMDALNKNQKRHNSSGSFFMSQEEKQIDR